jgi:hypothetical protein
VLLASDQGGGELRAIRSLAALDLGEFRDQPAPRLPTSSNTFNRSRVERASRSSRVTNSTSPGSSLRISLASSGLSVFTPLTFSR